VDRDPAYAQADAATAGEVVGAALLLDKWAARELDAMRRMYSPEQTEHGRKVAKEILAYAATDGFDALNASRNQGYIKTPTDTPNLWQWEPTGLLRTNAVEPRWGYLRTITPEASSCDIPAPDFQELEREGRKMLTIPDVENSASENVLLWLAGNGTPTPVGQWLAAATGYLRGMDAEIVNRTLAGVAVAGFDTGVLLWREKFEHMVARPETMHQRWFGKELFLARETPGHPSYPSGHSGFSRAAATILSEAADKPIIFNLPDDMLARATAYEFPNLDAAVAAASNSRVVAFFHFPSDVRAGEQLGRCAGEAVEAGLTQLTTKLLNREPFPPFNDVEVSGPPPAEGER